MLCADWLALSLGPVGVGSRSFLTEPPVRGAVLICGDSGAILGAAGIGAPVAGGGVGVRVGAAGADNLGAADLDWASEGALIMARSKTTTMEQIGDINPLLGDHSQIAPTMHHMGAPGTATPRSMVHARGVNEARCW